MNAFDFASTPTTSEGRTPLDAGRDAFPATRWSLLLAAGSEGSAEADRALEALCRRYWLPVYVTVRGSGVSAEEAKDLTQGVFEMLLRRSDFAKASPEKGRFRAFLRTAVKRFLLDDWRSQKTQKRDPGEPLISIDGEWAERAIDLAEDASGSPDQLFDYHWARELLDRCLKQLRALCVQEGKADDFDALVPYLDGTDANCGYARIGEAMGISEAGARSAMFRLRNRFRRFVREEIALTVSDETEIDEEIRHLFAALSR